VEFITHHTITELIVDQDEQLSLQDHWFPSGITPQNQLIEDMSHLLVEEGIKILTPLIGGFLFYIFVV
jgi:hypothetical protein